MSMNGIAKFHRARSCDLSIIAGEAISSQKSCDILPRAEPQLMQKLELDHAEIRIIRASAIL